MALDFNALAERAEKRAGKKKPFEMTMPDGEVISVPKPDAQISLKYERAQDLYSQLQLILDKDFPRVWEALKGKDPAVAQDLVVEMWRHWDDDSSTVTGGKGA